MEGFEALLVSLLQQPAGVVSVLIDPLGGAVTDIGPADTAFPHRNARATIQYVAQVTEQPHRQMAQTAVGAVHQAMQPFVSDGVYANYPNQELPAWGLAYWQHNFDRLRRVKSRYDPKNVFRHRQAVPLADE